MKKGLHITLIVGTIFGIGYYLLLAIVDFAFIGISLLWLFFGSVCLTLLILDKKHKLKPLFTGDTEVVCKKRQNVKVITISIIAVGVLYCCGNLLFICTPPKYKEGQKADYIILLGGGIKINGEPSFFVSKRLQAATDCWNSLNEKCPIIVTGGQIFPAPFAEAYMLSTELQKRGIPESYIICEPQALDTIQNFRYSTDLIAKNSDVSLAEALSKSVIVVTSNYHLARSVYLAQRMGFTDVTGYSASIPVYSVLNCYVREILAVFKLQIRVLLTGEPTVLA